jgi:hypothetical protein
VVKFTTASRMHEVDLSGQMDHGVLIRLVLLATAVRVLSAIKTRSRPAQQCQQ